MINAIHHQGLRKFFTKGTKSGIQASHAKRLQMQLAALHSAISIEDMNIPGWNLQSSVEDMGDQGWNLNSFTGNRNQQWSISVNKNWQLVFEFQDGEAQIMKYKSQ